MVKLIISSLPNTKGLSKGLWSDGYVIHGGKTKESLNLATLYSVKHKILPDQNKLKPKFDS